MANQLFRPNLELMKEVSALSAQSVPGFDYRASVSVSADYAIEVEKLLSDTQDALINAQNNLELKERQLKLVERKREQAEYDADMYKREKESMRREANECMQKMHNFAEIIQLHVERQGENTYPSYIGTITTAIDVLRREFMEYDQIPF